MPDPSRQILVDAHFVGDASYWTDVYSGQRMDAVVYRERRDRTLRLVDSLGLPRGSRILELGCGSGEVSVRLARAGFAVTATDTVGAMLQRTQERAREEGLELETRHTDAHALEYPSASFDVVVALGVIPWLHSPQDALVEIGRVLRTGGFAIVSADNARRLNELFDPGLTWVLAPARTALRRWRKPPAGSGAYRLAERHRPAELDRLLVGAGLEPLIRSSIGFGPVKFLGRTVFPGSFGRALHASLQAGADRGVPGLRTTGVHYLVLARRLGS